MFCFWFSILIHSLLQASTTNVMGFSKETERTEPPVCLFISIFLYNLSSELASSLCRSAETLRHVAATFVIVLQRRVL
jgi:hypothetical protein